MKQLTKKEMIDHLRFTGNFYHWEDGSILNDMINQYDKEIIQYDGKEYVEVYFEEDKAYFADLSKIESKIIEFAINIDDLCELFL